MNAHRKRQGQTHIRTGNVKVTVVPLQFMQACGPNRIQSLSYSQLAMGARAMQTHGRVSHPSHSATLAPGASSSTVGFHPPLPLLTLHSLLLPPQPSSPSLPCLPSAWPYPIHPFLSPLPAPSTPLPCFPSLQAVAFLLALLACWAPSRA